MMKPDLGIERWYQDHSNDMNGFDTNCVPMDPDIPSTALHFCASISAELYAITTTAYWH